MFIPGLAGRLIFVSRNYPAHKQLLALNLYECQRRSDSEHFALCQGKQQIKFA